MATCGSTSNIGEVGITCGESLCGTPSSTCDNNGCFKQLYKNLLASIEIKSSWNVPACGKTTIITVSNVTNIEVGMYLWNSSYGYIQVVSFNKSNGQLKVINPCITGSQYVGKFVPAYSLFIAATSPNILFSPLAPYLLSDFISPAVGFCVNVEVTDTSYFIEGGEIVLAGAFYRVSVIIDATHIRICNDGGGVAPNTQVKAFSAQGTPQYPIGILPFNEVFITDDSVSETGTNALIDAQVGSSVFNPSYHTTFFYKFNLIATYQLVFDLGPPSTLVSFLYQHSAYIKAISSQSGESTLIFPTDDIIPNGSIPIPSASTGIVFLSFAYFNVTTSPDPSVGDNVLISGLFKVAPRDTVILTGTSSIFIASPDPITRSASVSLSIIGKNSAF